MALVYVKLTSKFVDVGFQNPLGNFYGYQTGTASNNFGQMSETANGAANNTTTNITGATYTIERAYWQDYITDNLFYVVNGTQSNSGWDRLNINGDLWSRSLANYSTTAISGKTRWFWATSTNSFGTTTGADIPWNVELEVQDSLVSNSITNTSLSAAQVVNSVFTLNSAAVSYTQRYRIVLVSGTNADGDSPGAVIGTGVTYDGSPAQSITIGNGEQPTAGNTCNYKVQVSGEFASFTDDDAWADATGTNSTFSITRSQVAVGGVPPTERDHGNNAYIAMNGGTIAYATSQSSTVITTRNPSTNAESTVLTTGANPARGTFTATTGNIYFANKPIHFNSSGFGHRMVPLTAKGKEFGDYHTRYGNQTYFFYAEQDTNVLIYDNVTGGIEGTSTSSFVLSASTIQTYTRPLSNSATWIFFASDADMVMSKTGGSGSGAGDKHVLAPAATYIYYRRGQYVRAVDNSGVTNTTGGSGNPGVSYDTAGDRVVAVAIGDGAGGDSEQGQGDHNISNSYLWPWSLRDFVLVAPNTNTIHVESFASGAWTTEATYTFTGTATSPQSVRRDGDSGFTTAGTNWTGNAATFNTNTLWRFRGTNNFAVFVNDNSTDEESIWGYTATVVTAPTDISLGADPGTADELVSITATGANGQGGVIQVSEDNTNWDTNGTAYTFTRGTPKTIYSRRFLSSENLISASTYSEALTADYLDPDTSITTIGTQNLLYTATDFDITIANGSSNTVYEVRSTGFSGTIEGFRTGNGALTVSDAPAQGGQKTYYITAYRTTGSGGDGSTRSNIQSFLVNRAAPDTQPNPFNFTDVTGASRSTYQISSVQITGIDATATASVTQNNGNGDFAVDSNATAPVSGYSTANKNITNNQYLHARVLSSNTLGASVSSTFAVGGVSDNFNVTTTSDAADITIDITYFPADPELSLPAQLFFSSLPTGSNFTTDAGNTVRFTFFSPDPGITSVTLSNLNFFTNNSNAVISNGSNTTRTLLSSASPNTTDNILATTAGDDIIGDNFNITITPLEPDVSVSVANVTMAENDTTWSVTVTEEAPNTNASVTVYDVKEGTTTICSRTAAGTIGPISNQIPTFLGIPEEYGLYARIPVSSGGTNSQKFIGTFDVTRGTPPPPQDPLLNTYGVAIYDHNENLVTSFAESSSIARKIFTSTALTSTSQCTQIATGLYSLSAGNSVVLITSDPDGDSNPEGFKTLPYTFLSGSTLLLGRELYVSSSVSVTVIQTKGATITNEATPDYGIEIYNENGDLVVDDLAQCFAVREIIDCSGATVLAGTYSRFDITLVEGRYPFTATAPIPALQGPGLVKLTPPTLLFGGNSTYANSYKTVRVMLPAGTTSASGYNLAMLVDKEANPTYYGGASSDYGVQVTDSNGDITWDSSWRQAVINNVVNANQFTSGCSLLTVYDVETGFDGVSPPLAGVGQSAELSFLTNTFGQTRSITGLNIMDPENTFLLGGGLVGGKVQYYQTYVTGELGQAETPGFYGGGTHTPSVVITSNSSVNLVMDRLGDGPLPPQTNPNGDPTTWGTRVPTSTHANGYYVFTRIT